MLITITIILLVAAALLAGGLHLNKNFVPGPLDEALRLESSATKTANFVGTTKDLGLSHAPGGIGRAFAAVMKPSAGDRANSDETYTFVLRESADDSTYTDCGPAVAVTVAGTAFTTSAISIPGFVTQRYVRLTLTVAGTTPSITYEAWLVPLPQ